MATKHEGHVLAQNRKAWHDYFVEESYECGLSLKGTEVKSIRKGRASLKESYCIIRGGEIFVDGMHISPYEQGNVFNTDPLRPKKLLMHKNEILKLEQYVKRDGYAIVPLKLYIARNKVKLQIGLCKGKKLYDKRHSIADRDVKRAMDRAMKQYK